MIVVAFSLTVRIAVSGAVRIAVRNTVSGAVRDGELHRQGKKGSRRWPVRSIKHIKKTRTVLGGRIRVEDFF